MVKGSRKIDESLFETEQKVLQTAMADISSGKYYNNELLPHYQSLANNYHKLLRITRKIFRISDNQGQVLQRHQSEIQNLLDNANQGFLTFGRDLKVDQQYSAECTRIFGKRIAGIPINELLAPGENIVQAELAEIFEQVFLCHKDLAQTELQQFPATFRINEKDVRVECKLISQANRQDERTLIMMILTDITDRIKAEKQIRFLSYHDKLTGLYNRAYVETVLPDLENQESLPLSIIMADMNGLKLVNDVFGHQQGDLLLIALGQVLKKSCRQTDIIARWGGDEFLILLPRTGKNDCLKICERIRKACVEIVDYAIPLSAAIGMETKEDGVVQFAELFSLAENRMYNDKLKRSNEVRKAIITTMEEMLHNRCLDSDGHSKRIEQLAVNFLRFLGYEKDSTEINQLRQLVRLHDIGKIAIPKEILDKPEPLTPSEWDIIKSHSDIGYRMAQYIDERAVADIILAVHERWDGAGYPLGIEGKRIPFLARVFALIDAYDGLTDSCPNKSALDEQTALQAIEAGSGLQFDPLLVKRFIEFINNK